MEGRIRGCNDPYQKVEKVKLEGDPCVYDAAIIEFSSYEETDWNALRQQAAISAMQGLITNENYSSYTAKKAKAKKGDSAEIFISEVSKDAVMLADALIVKLKEE